MPTSRPNAVTQSSMMPVSVFANPWTASARVVKVRRNNRSPSRYGSGFSITALTTL